MPSTVMRSCLVGSCELQLAKWLVGSFELQGVGNAMIISLQHTKAINIITKLTFNSLVNMFSERLTMLRSHVTKFNPLSKRNISSLTWLKTYLPNC